MRSPTLQALGMESIKIPSPSAILDIPSSSPPSVPPAVTTGGGVGSSSSFPAPSISSSAPPARSSLSAARTGTAGGNASSKPKQSKSRNGTVYQTFSLIGYDIMVHGYEYMNGGA
ncbi:uncharacterized protein EURHEDRAFT_410788 [Aspergillus ruber CBS 135680]|uniref:Uncharacterized protein n=1 Tax=Aspergillus ruber (strain CBS 135680) TaxID=1388766 RepID=A0A017SJ93_ASPRC|nr:uncharacterized protein EURHEDRAFT_410788 [Aspergillus ruber CBS 135680]EYE96992.1 hypothetical protein EURHEDRAFT_410788 [Aspergillus ruber CBS 135680]